MTHALLEGSPQARVAAIAALVGRDAPPSAAELDALRDCLGDAQKLVQRRAAEAFAALAARGVEVRDLLRAALTAPELSRRWGAAYALARCGALSGEALPTLLAVIGLDDGDLRWAAGELLKQLAGTDRGAVSAALLAAARTPGAARKMALYCLRDLGVDEASDAALGALADEHLETRLAALAVLAKIHRDAGATAARIAALVDDPDPRMRRTAAATLGDLGVRSADVLERLQRAAASDDSALRRAAERSLAMLSG